MRLNKIEGRNSVNTLIIYDNHGVIFHQVTGDFATPSGLQHIIIEIPEGKYAESVDTRFTTHVVVLNDFQKSETEQLREELAITQQALNDLILGGVL